MVLLVQRMEVVVIKTVSKIVGATLLIIGLGIYCYPSLKDWQMSRDGSKILDAIQEERETAQLLPDRMTGQLVTDNRPIYERVQPELYQDMLAYNQDLIENGQVLKDAWDYEAPPVDLAHNDGSAAIGTITIPDMSVENMPLYLGASASNLSKGAAVMSQTSMPIGGESTNCVIAGHRGWSNQPFFLYITSMRVGSLVYINTPWETLAYKATSIEIISPYDIGAVKIQPGKDMVTLMSCHPYMAENESQKRRMVVYCERVDLASLDTSLDEVMNNDAVPTRVDDDTGSVQYDKIPVAETTDETAVLMEYYSRKIIFVAVLLGSFVFLGIRVVGMIRKRG